MLTSFDTWGIEATVKKSIGMFAFALWDKHDRTLTLCRDRLGEKPLYYGWQGDTFLFGSELKSFKVHPAFHAQVDRNSLALMMRHNYIPAPYSIYQGIQKTVARLTTNCFIAKPQCSATAILGRKAGGD